MARRLYATWAPNVGDLIVTSLRKLRDVRTSTWADAIPYSDEKIIGMVIGRYDGSSDWTRLTIVTQLGIFMVQAVRTSRDFVKIA